MPDDILISELSLAPAIDDSAVFPFSQDNGGTDATFKAPMSQMAGKIAETTTYANLHTTSKTLVGAINEAAQSGGSAELIGTASGSIATFADGGNGIPLKSCEVEIVAQQAGSGTPSPSNVRAISGFDAVDVVVTGINVWNENWESGVWDASGNKGTGAAIRSANHILLKPSTSYFCYNVFTRGLVVRFYDANKNITRSEQIINTSFTTNANEYYITINTYNDDNITTYTNNISINYPSTDTAYHAYTGGSYTCALPSTCYGGYGDVCKANGITETLKGIDLGSLSWTYASGVLSFYADLSDAITPIATGDTNAICSCYSRENSPSSGLSNNAFCVCDSSLSTAKRVFVRDDTYNGDANAFKTGVTGQMLVYKLATPTQLTTSALSIPTLSGKNNIYADSGDVDLKYFNENADEIAELIKVMT